MRLHTPRGAALEVVAEFPAGSGPFAALVLAPGQGYRLERPALAQVARHLLAQGVAVYRFNWAFSGGSGGPAGRPSADLADEMEDMGCVLAAARGDPRVAAAQLFVGGKSLGSLVAWRVLRADPALRGGLLLTPLCNQALAAPAGENYPGLAAEARPLLFISGDQDPLCAPAMLYRFAAVAGGNARVAVVGGDHAYESPALGEAAAAAALARHLADVGLLSAHFIADVLDGAMPG